MSAVVMDASVALRAVYATEPGHDDVIARLGELLRAGFEPVAPDLFPYEVGHSIRRGPGTASQRSALMLDALGLVRLVPPSLDTFVRAQSSSGRPSFYDAAHVALAEEVRAALWTEDGAVLRAHPDLAADTSGILRRLRG